MIGLFHCHPAWGISSWPPLFCCLHMDMCGDSKGPKEVAVLISLSWIWSAQAKVPGKPLIWLFHPLAAVLRRWGIREKKVLPVGFLMEIHFCFVFWHVYKDCPYSKDCNRHLSICLRSWNQNRMRFGAFLFHSKFGTFQLDGCIDVYRIGLIFIVWVTFDWLSLRRPLFELIVIQQL